MVDKTQLIEELGLSGVAPEVQDAVYDDFTLELGAAISDGLTDEAMQEFAAIANGDQAVISSWLDAHVPEYRDDPSYQELEIGYREDPEKVPADKAFALIEWIRVNRPDFERVVERVKRELKASLSAQSNG